MFKLFQKKISRYTAVFEPQEEGGYTVSIPSLPGCISEGDTFEETMHNIEEAASLYLEVVQTKKQTIPKEEQTIVAPIFVKI